MRKRVLKDDGHARRIWRDFRLTAEDYAALLEYQGGTCYLCQRATGKTKRLAVDHDHACCPDVPTCGECTRGLLCGSCNKIFGHLRDSAEAFERGSLYLRKPPARYVFDLRAGLYK